MAGFTYVGNQNAQYQNKITDKVAIKDTVVVTNGCALRWEDGRFDLAATNEKVSHIAELPMGTTSLTGDTAGTVECIGRRVQAGDTYRVAQGALADAACQKGDYCDTATSDSVAAASNNDLLIVAHNSVANTIDVQFEKRQFT